MADYTLLKAAIQQVIKTNGNQEITGLLLQQTLLSLIDDLNLTKQDKINFVTNAVTRFLREDGSFQEIPTPTGSFTNNVYLSETPSDVGAYKVLNYVPDSSETVKANTISAADGNKLVGTYLYPVGLSTNLVPAGPWSFIFNTFISSAVANTNIGVQCFVRNLAGVETNLFTAWSDDINSSSMAEIKINFSGQVYTVNDTDRMGVRIFLRTTSVPTATVSFIVGSNYSSYFNTPVAIRHKQIRALNEDSNYQHITSTEKTNFQAAYTDRFKWDGGSSGLNASNARESLGLRIGIDVLAYRTFGSAAENNTNDFLAYNGTAVDSNKLGGYAASEYQKTITAGTTLDYYRGDKTWQVLNTSVVPELTNLYFTSARSRSTVIDTLTLTNAAILSTDSFQTAFGKAQAQINNRAMLNGSLTQDFSVKSLNLDTTTLYKSDADFLKTLQSLFYYDSANDSIRALKNFYSVSGVSAFGIGTGGGGGEGVVVIDNLTSTLTNAALSANQGRILKGYIDLKQPQLNGTGLVRMSGTGVTYDNTSYATVSQLSGYATTSSLSNYLPLSGGTLTGGLSINTSIGYSALNLFLNGVLTGDIIAHSDTSLGVYINNRLTGDRLNIGAGGAGGFIFNGYNIYHANNSNKTSVDWSAKNLTLAGAITGATTITTSGQITLGGRLQIGEGGDYGAGVFYSDVNWGMIIAAKRLNPNIAQYRMATADDQDLLRINNDKSVVMYGSLTLAGSITGATSITASGTIRSNNGTIGALQLGQTAITNYVAGEISATSSTTYSPVGRMSFSLPTHGAGTNYGLTELMYIEVIGSDSKAAKISMLPFGGNVTIGGAATFSSTVSATGFIENGTTLASKYLGISAKAADSDLFDGINSDKFVYGNRNGGYYRIYDSNNNDLNQVWRSGFYAGYDIINAPVGSFFGVINIPTYLDMGGTTQYNLQIGSPMDSSNLYFRSTGATGVGDWKVLYHTGNLTNTLSPGYLPYWNNGSLVNSDAWTNGSNLVIGTSTVPSISGNASKLDIYQGSVEKWLSISGTSDAPKSIGWIDRTNSRAWIWSHRTDNSFNSYYYNGSSWLLSMSLATNGNVGIGYTNRSEKFAVDGSGYFNSHLSIGGSHDVYSQVFINSTFGTTNNAALRLIYSGSLSALGEVAMLAHRNTNWSLIYGNTVGSSLTWGLYIQGSKPNYFEGTVSSATSVTAPTITASTELKIGAGWSAIQNGTSLDLRYGGVMKARLDSSGNITAVGGVTAFAV